MSTNVKMIDIMAAFHRWDPLDVKQLFDEEFGEKLNEKDKQIEELKRQLSLYESIDGPKGVKELNERNIKINSLINENQLIRKTNNKIFSEGQMIINELRRRVTHLTGQLNDAIKQLDYKQKQINRKRSSSDLNSSPMSDSGIRSDQTGVQSINVNQLEDMTQELENNVNELQVQTLNAKRMRFLIRKIISLNSENSKLRQKFKEKFGETEDIGDQSIDNNNSYHFLIQLEDNKKFEEFCERFKHCFIDKSTQTST